MIKKYVLLAGMFFLILFVSACGGAEKAVEDSSPVNQSSNKNAETVTETEKELEPAEPVTITFYEGSSGRSKEWFMDLYGNDIEEKFPHVTTEFRYMQQVNDKMVGLAELIASGENNIDIVITSTGSIIPHLIESGLAYDHSELIAKHNYDLSKINSTPIEQLKALTNGQIVGLPITATANALVYNVDLFDQFGVEYPQDGMFWDEVYDLAVRMTRTADGRQYRGFAASHSHVALVNQLSASYVDPETKQALFATDPRWVTHSQNMKRFHDIPGNEVDASTVGAAHAQFYSEQIAAMYVNSLDATWLDPAKGVPNADAVQMPFYKELPGVGSQLYPTYFSVTSTSKKKDEAFQVIAWLTSDEYQMERAKRGFTPISTNPAVREAIGADLPYLEGKNPQAFLPQNPAAPSILTPYNAMANLEFLLKLREYMIGEIDDVNTMLRETAEIVNAKIAEMND